jgi:hypothetical protein
VVAQSEDSDLKAELAAISSMVGILEPLSAATRANVIDYVFKRLGITFPTAAMIATSASNDGESRTPGGGAEGGQTVAEHTKVSQPLRVIGEGIVDLRSLKEAKQPTSTNEMVALVAYYLAHEAPAEERRDQIGAEDIPRYFREAGFPLPQVPNMALTRAKNAGYLATVERGQYRLSAVGHNLVAHRMGADKREKPPRRKPSRSRAATGKPAKRKASKRAR